MADELRVLSGPQVPSGPARPEDLPVEAQALAVLAVGEEAGQEAATDELVAGGLGAVVCFASALRDPAAAARRAGALQSAAQASPVGAPLLLAADEEGGRVSRLPSGPARLPGAMALGAAARGAAARAGAAVAREAGRATAGRLRAVGLNWDLAPVCDLWRSDNPALDGRCFSADPAAAAALAAAFAEGLQDGGVLACAKHFPGHGGTSVDSHRGLPVLTGRDEDALRPFAACRGAASLMLGHLLVPAVDPGLPASLSPAFYRMARDLAGPAALLATDSLSMQGCVRAADDVGEAAVLALLAGADVVLIAHGPAAHRAAWRAIADAARTGRLPRARLAEAVARVLAAKRRWGLGRRAAPDPDAVPHLLGRPSDARLASEIAAASITELAPGEAAPLPRRLRTAAPGSALARAAAERWRQAEVVATAGAAPWLSLDDRCHLLIGPPIPADLPPGRVLLAYDATPASLEALLACAAGAAPAPGRLPR
jgi:beta-N-acetylhexosaminidase